MTKIVVTEFVSLDGCIDEPRWTFQFDRGPEGDKFKWDELFDCDGLLLGRVTYQGFAQAWPLSGPGHGSLRDNDLESRRAHLVAAAGIRVSLPIGDG